MSDRVETEVDNKIYTIFDTSSPTIGISHYYYDDFIKKIEEKVGEDAIQIPGKENASFYCDEEMDFPDLWFAFDGWWIQVKPEHYYSRDGPLCELDIVKIDQSYNIMGLPLLAGYYTTFYAQTGSIEISLLKEDFSNKNQIQRFQYAGGTLKSNFNGSTVDPTPEPTDSGDGDDSGEDPFVDDFCLSYPNQPECQD